LTRQDPVRSYSVPTARADGRAEAVADTEQAEDHAVSGRGALRMLVLDLGDR